MPGLGTLPADWLDLPLLAGALRGQPRRRLADCALRYGEPAGDARLRQALSHKLAELRRHGGAASRSSPPSARRRRWTW